MHFPAASAASAAAPADLWAVLVDGATWNRWNQALAWAVFEGPPAVGGYVTLKPRRGRQTAFRIAAAAEPALLVLELTFGPLAALRLEWAVAARTEGSLIEGRVAVDGPLAALLVRRMAERAAAALPANLERLAAFAGAKKGAAEIGRADE